ATGPEGKIKGIALLGGLTVHWATAHPSSTGRPVTHSFWRGDPGPDPSVTVPLPPRVELTPGVEITSSPPAAPPTVPASAGPVAPAAPALVRSQLHGYQSRERRPGEWSESFALPLYFPPTDAPFGVPKVFPVEVDVSTEGVDTPQSLFWPAGQPFVPELPG